MYILYGLSDYKIKIFSIFLIIGICCFFNPLRDKFILKCATFALQRNLKVSMVNKVEKTTKFCLQNVVE